MGDELVLGFVGAYFLIMSFVWVAVIFALEILEKIINTKIGTNKNKLWSALFVSCILTAFATLTLNANIL